LSQSASHGLADVPSQHVRSGLFTDLGVDGLPASDFQFLYPIAQILSDEPFVDARPQVPRFHHDRSFDPSCHDGSVLTAVTDDRRPCTEK
jgi:hypothetical protein